MAIDPYARYGNTSPVKYCGEAHGVPPEHAYVVADYILHQRYTVWNYHAEVWMSEHLTAEKVKAFILDLTAVLARARPKAA